MLPTSRVKRTRPPLAATSKISAAAAPLKVSVSAPSWPSTRVAAVARVPGEAVVAGAEQRQVVALVAVDDVGAVVGDQGIRAAAAANRVGAGSRRRR